VRRECRRVEASRPSRGRKRPNPRPARVHTYLTFVPSPRHHRFVKLIFLPHQNTKGLCRRRRRHFRPGEDTVEYKKDGVPSCSSRRSSFVPTAQQNFTRTTHLSCHRETPGHQGCRLCTWMTTSQETSQTSSVCSARIEFRLRPSMFRFIRCVDSQFQVQHYCMLTHIHKHICPQWE